VRCLVRTSAGAHIILPYFIVVISSSLAIPEEYFKLDHKRFVERGLQSIACRYSVLRRDLSYSRMRRNKRTTSDLLPDLGLNILRTRDVRLPLRCKRYIPSCEM
jgi:hypothetical protein